MKFFTYDQLTEDIIEKWCNDNNFLLIQKYQDGEEKPYTNAEIRKRGVKGIVQDVAEIAEISPDELVKDSRKRDFVEPRQMVHYICRHRTPLSMARIGWMVGRKDHATVLYSERKVKEMLEVDRYFRERWEHIIFKYRLIA